MREEEAAEVVRAAIGWEATSPDTASELVLRLTGMYILRSLIVDTYIRVVARQLIKEEEIALNIYNQAYYCA